MEVRFSIRVDGTEFEKRTHSGQIVTFLQIRDSDGQVFQTHRAMKLPENNNLKTLAYASFDQRAFLRPGEYEVTSAIYDAETKEHEVKREKLHVHSPSHDPLPDSWQTLPSVEFIAASDPPDSWYLPGIRSRLNLPVETREPVRVEVVVNESAAEAAPTRLGHSLRRNMGNLIPSLKVISQLDIKNGSLNITLLDLERRKTGFAQQHVGTFDWSKLRAALTENYPNLIDVHALENHEQNAQFFVSEIKKHLETDSAAARVLIVLSAPMVFAKGQDLTPIEAAPEPGTRVFYIRYYPSRAAPDEVWIGAQGGRRAQPPPFPRSGRGPIIDDSLVRTLKPLSPRVFDVTSPLEFRSALTAIITEISHPK